MSDFTRRLVVGISGSSGPIYGIRTLETLRAEGRTEIHLVLSDAALQTIHLETDRNVDEICALAHFTYKNSDLTAPVSSGSFQTDGMIVAPCSMRSLSEIANSLAAGLLTRAADVHLKERRKLILLVRETPLHLGHLRNMVKAAETGAVILPPIPGFYHRPETVDDIVNHSVGKALDLMSIPHDLYRRWRGP